MLLLLWGTRERIGDFAQWLVMLLKIENLIIDPTREEWIRLLRMEDGGFLLHHTSRHNIYIETSRDCIQYFLHLLRTT